MRFFLAEPLNDSMLGDSTAIMFFCFIRKQPFLKKDPIAINDDRGEW